ncbi:Por secretion system C-terminal sorting domain-containing protein [Chitinophaga sp. YR573]|uniref:T9SS type A sorting domain-containing protein n=1 Tax=Chitinophaga sp. YR573 TaxID=1881040 RepID=UPI0008D165A3|nr:T9SS type A sorting domain-containing protein [Chitinophaga sp. YR573]SEW36209.1 Por secretion system C-terminal sorting domain-containing protein [Chitinophaga sp. YR573]
MQKYICVLVFWLAYLPVFSQTVLNAGVYNNGDNTYTLRWATNDKTLSTGPRVVGLGSSTLAGYLLSYPDRLGDKISIWLNNNTTSPVWINLAVAGYSSTNLMPTAEGGNVGTNIDSALNSNPDFIFISLPTNDIANGLTINQILANFRKLDTMALNRGIPIFWETTQPRNTFTDVQQQQLKTLADSIRVIWPKRYVEGFSNTVDSSASTAAQIKAGYGAGDGVHLNTTGNQQIADSLFARWQSYFTAIQGVAGYVVETSADSSTWTQLDVISDPTLVKKTYTGTGLQYFRVKALYTNTTYSAYSNTVVLPATASNTTPVNISSPNRILVDLGGDGMNTVLPNGTPAGQATVSPDAYGDYWNNWFGSGGSSGFRDGAGISKLVTTNNSATTVSMKIVGQPDGTYNSTATTRGINYNGFTVASNDYPATALSDNMFLYNSINPNGVILRITGLTAKKTYSFKLWGARVDNTTTPRIMETRLGSQAWISAKTMETRYSSADTPDYNRAIVYDSITGLDSLDIYMRPGTGSTFTSLSLVDINIINPVTIDTTEVCAGSNLTLSSTLTGTSYQWQQYTGSGYTNISGQTTHTLSLTNIQASSLYRCKTGTDTSQVFFVTLIVNTTPAVSISTTDSTGCYGNSFVFTANVENAGNSLVYQWLVDGVAAGTNSSTFSGILTDRSTVQVRLTSSNTCITQTVTSNIITVYVDSIVTPTIVIKGPIDLPMSTATQLTATVTHEGTSPLYQWMDSTSTHTWTNISNATTATLSYLPAYTGDKVLCRLTSNAGCLSSATVFSTPLTFTVQLVTAVDPEPAAKYGIRLYPNPVSSVLALAPLKPTDGWASLEIRSVGGKLIYTTTQIKNQTSMSIPVSNLENGVYVVVLRGTNAKVATIKFVKM